MKPHSCPMSDANIMPATVATYADGSRMAAICPAYVHPADKQKKKNQNVQKRASVSAAPASNV